MMNSLASTAMRRFSQSSSLSQLMLCAVSALVVTLFFANAWVSDDAYINFRSIEQLFAGNGPRWNPHERVQVYTSPAWYFLLAAARLFTANLYIASILLSFCICVAAIAVAARLLTTGALTMLLLALMTSASFFDYSSSGLENALSYLVIACFFWLMFGPAQSARQRLVCLLMVAGIAPLVRHDLVVMIWPATVLVYLAHRHTVSRSFMLKWILLAALPLTLWSLFSLVYYGLIFPNTAYAKLNTGLERSHLINAGFVYLYQTAKNDPLLALLLLTGVPFFIYVGGYFRAASLGILLHILYVINIGGDFMRGRFLAVDFLLVCLLFACWFSQTQRSRLALLIGGLAIVASSLASYATPLRTAFASYDPALVESGSGGVYDERQTYMYVNGLLNRLHEHGATHKLQACFIGRCVDREVLKNCDSNVPSQQCTLVYGMIGQFGYTAGIGARIIDFYALADPLLAQLPIKLSPLTGPGHYARDIPDGYVESVVAGKNLIVDDNIHQLYEKLRLVTESEAWFEPRRLKAIWDLNSGALHPLAQQPYAGINGIHVSIMQLEAIAAQQ